MQDLKYHPYKAVSRHELQAGDPQRRLNFCHWLVQLPNAEVLRILSSDEATFQLHGQVNSQNIRRYSPLKSFDPANGGRPDHFVEESRNFSPKVMVFCGLRQDGTFGLKFYRNQTLTGVTYHSLLQYTVLPELRNWNGGNLDQLYWQQDGALTEACATLTISLVTTSSVGGLCAEENGPLAHPTYPLLTSFCGGS